MTSKETMAASRNAGSEPGLTLSQLSKIYPGTPQAAVESLDLAVGVGQLVALLGPSGCGKTTTLRMVAGLLEPSGGTISVGGRDITHTPVHKRELGMVFQSYALFPHLNVRQNVEFGLAMRKVSKADKAQRVSNALAMVQLGHLADRKPRELSGGQQQRIALARALVVEPKLLLLDEPLSNLDAKLRESLRVEIRQIQQRLGITTLFVTHDQDEALNMADVIAVMSNGRIEQLGSPTEIYEEPATLFVANFIGQANLIPINVLGAATGTTEYAIDMLGLNGAAGGPAGVAPGTATLLVRPHRVTVTAGDEAAASPVSGSFRVTGDIIESSYTGDSASYVIAAAGTRITATAATGTAPLHQVGSTVTVSWVPQDSFIIQETAGRS